LGDKCIVFPKKPQPDEYGRYRWESIGPAGHDDEGMLKMTERQASRYLQYEGASTYGESPFAFF
jgi:hypothetical protein